MPAALLGRVLAVACVVVLVLSPAAAVSPVIRRENISIRPPTSSAGRDQFSVEKE